MSFAETPTPSCPLTRISIVGGFNCHKVCVDNTCSTSEVPIPKAMAPNAPCVAVCESPHTIVLPGCVNPSSGPITWTIPWSGCPISANSTPNSCAFSASVIICFLAIGSLIVGKFLVGTL